MPQIFLICSTGRAFVLWGPPSKCEATLGLYMLNWSTWECTVTNVSVVSIRSSQYLKHIRVANVDMCTPHCSSWVCLQLAVSALLLEVPAQDLAALEHANASVQILIAQSCSKRGLSQAIGLCIEASEEYSHPCSSSAERCSLWSMGNTARMVSHSSQLPNWKMLHFKLY